MNRPFLRELAKRAGYTVGMRSSHSLAVAYDWHPKGPMQSSHFRSEEAAWASVEKHLFDLLEQAHKLDLIAYTMIREGHQTDAY